MWLINPAQCLHFLRALVNIIIHTNSYVWYYTFCCKKSLKKK